MGKLIIKDKFATTPNEILNHEELSLRAKGMFAFLQSKPENWQFSNDRIALQLKESSKVVRKVLQELEQFGLLKRSNRKKDEEGKWTGYDYTLFNSINIISNKPSLPKRVERIIGNTDNREDISKQEISKKDIVIKNISIAETSSAGEVIPDLLNDNQKHIQIIGLYAISKNIDFKSKKQQQDFIKRNIRPARLIDSYDLERIKETIRYLMINADFKWTLESVGKYIDEDLNKLKTNNNIVIIQ